MHLFHRSKQILFLTVFAIYLTPVSASELVYQPRNPTFGGNPLNSNHFINIANIFNDFQDPELRELRRERESRAESSIADRLAASIQSRLLSELISDISDGRTGSLTTDDFIIDVIDDAGVLSVVITDRNTFEVTEIEVDGLSTGLQ